MVRIVSSLSPARPMSMPAPGFRAQPVQAFENIKTALASVGGSTDSVERLVTDMTDLEQNADPIQPTSASACAPVNYARSLCAFLVPWKMVYESPTGASSLGALTCASDVVFGTA